MEPNHRHITGLPPSLISPVDLGRLLRELEQLDLEMQAQRLRHPDQEPKVPRTSIMMDEIMILNKLNLAVDSDRQTLREFLSTLKKRAPRLHVSFSADPSPLFVEKLVAWFRREVHPATLMTIGLQPNIGAGCLVRTTNKYFDLSLAKDFSRQRELLMGMLHNPVPIKDQPIMANNQSVVPAPVASSAPATPTPKW